MVSPTSDLHLIQRADYAGTTSLSLKCKLIKRIFQIIKEDSNKLPCSLFGLLTFYNESD